ncbi:MAG: hypothetical protein RJA36_3607 [Pseudomonadota bacterium]|jgi:fumarylacetoacetate (FAA) hydrolase
MKLATYKDGSRDGQLIVVSRDLASAHYATGIASTLQQVLDDWNFIAPQLQDLYVALNQGRARHAFPFEAARCMAPLPRAYRWVVAAAYRNHVELLQGKAAATTALREAAADAFLGPCDDLVLFDEASELDFGAGLAVVTGDLPARCSAEQGLDGIRLLLLANDWCLRALLPRGEDDSGGPPQAHPATAFGPVAVTLDELGDAWERGRPRLTLQASWNGRKVGMCDAGEMDCHFGQLLALLSRSRGIAAGSVVGGGVVANPAVSTGDRREWPRGAGCLAQRRAIEREQGSQAPAAYLGYGDTVRIEVRGRDGHSLFGAIEQTVLPPE